MFEITWGVKTRIGFIGLDGRATDCPTSKNSQLESILKWAHFAGKSTGIVTTTRVVLAFNFTLLRWNFKFQMFKKGNTCDASR